MRSRPRMSARSVERKTVHIDQMRRRFDLQLHEVEQVRPAREKPAPCLLAAAAAASAGASRVHK